jgi:hypothetical protein
MHTDDLLFLTKIVPTQDLTGKVKEGEEEIARLKKHLADYSVKVIIFLHGIVNSTQFYCTSFLPFTDHKQLLTGSTNT